MPLTIQGILRPAIPAQLFDAFVRSALLAIQQHQGWEVQFNAALQQNDVVATCTKRFLSVMLRVDVEFRWVSATADSTTIRVSQTLTVQTMRPLVGEYFSSATLVRLLAQYNNAFRNGYPLLGTLASFAFLDAIEYAYYTAMLRWIERWAHADNAILLNSGAEFAEVKDDGRVRVVNIGRPRGLDEQWREFRMIQNWTPPESGGGLASGAAAYERDRKVWTTPVKFGRGRGAAVPSRLRGLYQFVVLLNGRIQIGNKGHSAAYGVMLPADAQGSPVAFAGEAEFRNGVLQHWTNNSGHYRPNPAFAFQAGFPLAQFRAVARQPIGDLLELRNQLTTLLRTYGLPQELIELVVHYLFLYFNRIAY